jgi:hypothetical protein
VALPLPRNNRIRWEKPASQAGTHAEMQVFVEAT